MQCPSCAFQNLPGQSQCARCGSMLAFAEVAVCPYRASDRWARWRYWRRRRREWPRWLRPMRDVLPSSPTMVVASIVPGLGHMLGGRRRRGGILLAAWLLVLLLWVLFLSWGWMLFGTVLLALHTFAISECFIWDEQAVPTPRQVGLSLLVFLLLCFGVYPGVGWLVGGFRQFEWVGSDIRGDVLAPGDVVMLTGRWLAPEAYGPGDMVGYAMSERRGQGWYIPAGVRLDRIVAVSGDRVQSSGHFLRVNGRPLPPGRGLLVPTFLPEHLDLIVPPGQFFIYPTLPRVNVAMNAEGARREAELRLSVSLVPAERIRGRVLGIVNPLDRVRRFQEGPP
ncbi:MAG: hypothetical protein AMXMBFR13_22570 [Phycisphaerae bacterium]